MFHDYGATKTTISAIASIAAVAPIAAPASCSAFATCAAVQRYCDVAPTTVCGTTSTAGATGAASSPKATYTVPSRAAATTTAKDCSIVYLCCRKSDHSSISATRSASGSAGGTAIGSAKARYSNPTNVSSATGSCRPSSASRSTCTSNATERSKSCPS